MPLYKEWKDEDCHVAIWKIEESISFFENALHFQSDRLQERRKLEHLSSRFLLQFMDKSFPVDQILVSPNGKPYLDKNPIYFSITHSFPFVAVSIHQHHSTGIDLQVFQPKIIRLQPKFLSFEEQLISNNSLEIITLLWTAKEAGFKWFGKGGLDFIKHMPIKTLEMHQETANLLMEFNKEDMSKELLLNGGIENEFAWSVSHNFVK